MAVPSHVWLCAWFWQTFWHEQQGIKCVVRCKNERAQRGQQYRERHNDCAKNYEWVTEGQHTFFSDSSVEMKRLIANFHNQAPHLMGKCAWAHPNAVCVQYACRSHWIFWCGILRNKVLDKHNYNINVYRTNRGYLKKWARLFSFLLLLFLNTVCSDDWLTDWLTDIVITPCGAAQKPLDNEQ